MSSKRRIFRKRDGLIRAECTEYGCADRDELAMSILEYHVLFEQEQFLKHGGFPCASEMAYSGLLTIEMTHRDVMEQTRCDDCLEDFKRKKFYVLDGEGYQYSAHGLAGKRAALAG